MEKNNESINTNTQNHTNANEGTTKPLPVYNLIILDKSGSMHCVKREAVDAYNETLGTIKAAQEKYIDCQQQFISLALFCNCGIDMVYDRVPAAEAEMMEYDRYCPCCGTPLFDAIGNTITQLKNYADAHGDYAALVTIITDGYENASHEWTGAAIKSLIDECRKKGWMVSFVGAMEDAEQIALSISITNVSHWKQTHEGTQEMSCKEQSSRDRYFSRLKRNINHCISLNLSAEACIESRRKIAENYYDEDNAEAPKEDTKK